MILRENEQVLHIVYHHFLPYVKRCIYFILITFIFSIFIYFLLEFFMNFKFIILTVYFLALLLAFLNMTFIYWLDKLVITNQRLIYINWISVTNVQENEINLKDIQDIASFDRGIIRFVPFLSYGKIVIKSSAYRFDISFEEIGKPKSVREFITRIKHYDK